MQLNNFTIPYADVKPQWAEAAQGLNNFGASLKDVLAYKMQEQDAIKKIMLEHELNNKQAQYEQQIAMQDPVRQMLQQGKIADAQMKMYEAGGPAPSMYGGQPVNQQQVGQQVIPQANQQARMTVNPQLNLNPLQTKAPQSGEYYAPNLDAFGRAKGYKLKEPSAAQQKRDVEIKELDSQIKNLIESYRNARTEADNVPFVGGEGISGRMGGLAAVGKGKLGYSPAVNVYQDRIKAFATTVAKAAGEVRPTDKDIERFINTLPTLTKNDEENEIIIQGLINDLQSRGAKAVWSERIGGVDEDDPITFTSEEEAMNADLPPGTEIFINGRRAIVE